MVKGSQCTGTEIQCHKPKIERSGSLLCRGGRLLCSRGRCSPRIPAVSGKWLQKAWAGGLGTWEAPSFSAVAEKPESHRKAGLSPLERCLMALHLQRGSYGQVPSQHRWHWVPAPQPAQPGSKSFSQLLLFFVFLTKRPLSGQGAFMGQVHLLPPTEWGTT